MPWFLKPLFSVMRIESIKTLGPDFFALIITIMNSDFEGFIESFLQSYHSKEKTQSIINLSDRLFQ